MRNNFVQDLKDEGRYIPPNVVASLPSLGRDSGRPVQSNIDKPIQQFEILRKKSEMKPVQSNIAWLSDSEEEIRNGTDSSPDKQHPVFAAFSPKKRGNIFRLCVI